MDITFNSFSKSEEEQNNKIFYDLAKQYRYTNTNIRISHSAIFKIGQENFEPTSSISDYKKGYIEISTGNDEPSGLTNTSKFAAAISDKLNCLTIIEHNGQSIYIEEQEAHDIVARNAFDEFSKKTFDAYLAKAKKSEAVLTS